MNHFEHHSCITSKDQLFFNIKKVCELRQQNVWNVLPVTFVLDFTNKYALEADTDKIYNFFNVIERNRH